VELDLDFTDTRTVSAGENVVTFTDPAPFDTGVCDKDRFIACTLVSFHEDGTIASAVVAFNPYKRHSSVGLADTHDIGLIMMHEMGHVLGLDHSFVGDSVMLGHAEQEPAPGAPPMFAVRRLAEDDLNTLAKLYPIAPGSAIAGTVGRGGVRVMAIDSLGRVPNGVLSNDDGSYSLLVSPGGYTVAAEPGDGPAALAAGVVAVQEGATKEGVDITVTSGSKLTVDTVGVVLNGFYAGMPRVDLARGRNHSLALTRTPLSLAVDLLAPEAAVTPMGNPSSPTSAPQLVRKPVTVKADAAVGSYGLIVRAGEVGAILPSALRIVTNPQIESIKDAETGETVETLRAGRRYKIQGTDLAASETEASPEFEGAPAPSQLNGIVVRVAGRFVPLVSAKPEELVFELPAAAGSGEAKLLVASGTSMESNIVTVRLVLE
jgi:hypothetical protein